MNMHKDSECPSPKDSSTDNSENRTSIILLKTFSGRIIPDPLAGTAAHILNPLIKILCLFQSSPSSSLASSLSPTSTASSCRHDHCCWLPDFVQFLLKSHNLLFFHWVWCDTFFTTSPVLSCTCMLKKQYCFILFLILLK